MSTGFINQYNNDNTNNYVQYIKYGRDFNIENLILGEGEFAFNIETGIMYGGGLDGSIFVINPKSINIAEINKAIEDKIGKEGGTIDGILVVKQGIQTEALQTNNLTLGDYEFYKEKESINNINHTLNYASLILRNGQRLFDDEEFYYGNNKIEVYNKVVDSDTVDVTRIKDNSAPNSTQNVLEVRTSSVTGVSPFLGGVCQPITYSYNKRFATIFKANLPTGFEFAIDTLEIGIGGSAYFISSNKGTGKWENYIIMWSCGNLGAVSSGGYVYVKGGSPVNWRIASYSTFDITDVGGSTEEDHIIKDFASHLEFPSIGSLNTLYLDRKEDELYRWDNVKLIYKRVASDYNSIGTIYGGSAIS